MSKTRRHKKSRRSVEHIATSTIATLLTASGAQASIYTNAMIGLSGFTVGDVGEGCVNSHGWSIDNSGNTQVTIKTSFSKVPHYYHHGSNPSTETDSTIFSTQRFIRAVSTNSSFGFIMSGSNLLNKAVGAAINASGNFGVPSNLLKSGAAYALASFTSGTKGYIGFTVLQRHG